MAGVIPPGFHELFSASAAVAGVLIGGPSIGLGRELAAIARTRVPRDRAGAAGPGRGQRESSR
jgi:hypothetical protein